MEQLAKLLEVVGVGIILAGVVLASFWFLRDGRRSGDWRASYDRYRASVTVGSRTARTLAHAHAGRMSHLLFGTATKSTRRVVRAVL